MPTRKILILGASYGSLLGVKLAPAAHLLPLVCLPQSTPLNNATAALLRWPVQAPDGPA